MTLGIIPDATREIDLVNSQYKGKAVLHRHLVTLLTTWHFS